MPPDPSYWLERFNGNERLTAFVVGGLTRHKCDWCERELRPCNMARHIAAQHYRQLTIDDMIESEPEPQIA